MHLFCFSRSYRHGMSAKFVKFRANSGYASVTGVQWPWLPCPFKFNGVENRDLAKGGNLSFMIGWCENILFCMCVCVQNCVSTVWMLCGCGLWFYFPQLSAAEWWAAGREGRDSGVETLMLNLTRRASGLEVFTVPHLTHKCSKVSLQPGVMDKCKIVTQKKSICLCLRTPATKHKASSANANKVAYITDS